MFEKVLRLAYPPTPGLRGSLALLVLRVAFGLAIFVHGYGKIGNITGFSENVGVPVVLGGLAVVTEIVGGVLIVAGALFPLAAVFLTGNMAYALYYHLVVRGDSIMAGAGEPSGEKAALYLVVFATLLLTGPGMFAVDRMLFRKLP